MNAFEKFVSEHPGGFLRDVDMPELVKLSRLCQCVVRCGRVRFTCGAQYVAEMVAMVEKSDDYVRDVSISHQEIESANKWQPERTFGQMCPHRTPEERKAILANAKPDPYLKPPKRVCGPDFDESDCGGVFDGFGVVSDADPGL